MNSHLLFVTNFSEACFQALPAISEWMDREQGHVTLLHVARPGDRTAHDRLHSFFAEAHGYPRFERVLLTGRPLDVIADYCRAESPDVVFAPASKPSGLPRIFHRSLRAGLISQGIKLWTRGRNAVIRAPRNVAHLVTGHPDWAAEVCQSARFAAGYGAKFHLLYLAPWPEIHDGTFASDLRLAHPTVKLADVEDLMRRLPVHHELHTAMGSDPFTLLRQSQADAAFVPEAHAIQRRLFSELIHPALDTLDCELYCIPTQPLPQPDLRPHPRLQLWDPTTADGR